MKRWVVLLALLAVGFALAGVGLGSPSRPLQGTSSTTTTTKKATKQPKPKKATTTIRTTDHGCAGNVWANDTTRRTVKVHRNKDGSYRIREEDKGTFQTVAGNSPGNCAANRSRHGHTVRAGVVGTLKGYISGTVIGGTFNPNATCSANPCTQATFIAAFFGPSARFSCLTSSRDCKFKYDYHAKKNQNLLFRHWEDKGKGAGSFLREQFKGDIADA